MGRFSGGKLGRDLRRQCRRSALQCDVRPNPENPSARGDQTHPTASRSSRRRRTAGRCRTHPRTDHHRRADAARWKTYLDRARGQWSLGSYVCPPHLSQFAHALRSARGRHAGQGQFLFAHRLSGSRGHGALPPARDGGLRKICRRRLRQNHSRLSRRRNRLHRLHSLDAQNARDV